MTIPLDTLVARAVHQAHVLERAVNESGSWTMTLGTPSKSAAQVSAARRDLYDDRVVFTAEFAPTIEQATMVTLNLNGAMQSVRTVEFATTAEAFAVTWVIEAAAVPSLA